LDFEEKRQRAAMLRQVVRQPGCILGRVRLHAGKRSVWLGFDGSECLAIEIKKVIGETESGFRLKFPNGNAASCRMSS
jgi:hypothetical protein